MTDTSIRLTDAVLARVKPMLAEHSDPRLKLRARVEGCACEGFQYEFSLDPAVHAGDVTLAQDGVALVVDAVSYPHLQGAEIDSLPGTQGLHFVVRNANLEAACGC